VAIGTGQTARKSLVAVADRTVVAVVNMGTGVLVGRCCEPADFAAYVVAFSIFVLSTMVQQALVAGPLSILGASRDGADAVRFSGSMLVLQSLAALLMSALVAVSAVLLHTLGASGPAMTSSLLALAGVLFFLQTRDFLRTLFFSRLYPGRALVVDCIFSAVYVASVGCLWLGSTGAWSPPRPGMLSGHTVFLAAGTSAALALLPGIWMARNLLERPSSSLPSHLSEAWRFGRWGLIRSGSNYVNTYSSLYALGLLSSAAEVAALGAIRQVVNLLPLVFQPALNIMVPKLARAYVGAGWATANRKMWIYACGLMVLAAPLCIATSVCARPIMHHLYAGRYDSYAMIASVWIVFQVVLKIPLLFLFTMSAVTRRPWIRAMASLAATPLTLVGLILMVPSLGVLGAMAVTSSVGVAICVASYAWTAVCEKRGPVENALAETT